MANPHSSSKYRQRISCVKAAATLRARRNARASRVFTLLDAGHTKEEVEEITGLSRTSINVYLRTLR